MLFKTVNLSIFQFYLKDFIIINSIYLSLSAFVVIRAMENIEFYILAISIVVPSIGLVHFLG